MKKLIVLLLFCSAAMLGQRTHTDKKAGFEIKIPRDWKKERMKDWQVVALKYDIENKSLESRMFVTVKEHRTVSPDSIVDNFVRNQQYHYPTFTVIENDKTQVNGLEFHRIVGSHNVPEGTFTTISYVYSGDGKWIILDFGAANEKFIMNQQTYAQIAQSFLLKTPGNEKSK